MAEMNTQTPRNVEGKKLKLGQKIFVRIFSSLNNEYIEYPAYGFIKITELAVDGSVITGNFYPKGMKAGYGGVTWPKFELIKALS